MGTKEEELTTRTTRTRTREKGQEQKKRSSRQQAQIQEQQRPVEQGQEKEVAEVTAQEADWTGGVSEEPD